jgi:ribonucleoside-diphosphate reductase alpha chain
MLKTIIKRDGSTEAFEPSKLNKWSQWASEGLRDRVDWSGVVLETVKGFGQTTHSQELQKQLIATCTMRRDWAHNLMAGRLYAALYKKEIYPQGIPIVKELHTELQSVGLMIKLDYAQEEYDTINTYIEHERDFELAHFQIKQIRSKYAIKNRATGKEYETPQFVYMRMAMQLAESEPKETRLKDVLEYYNHFSFNRINPPSPNYINLGTPLKGYASCCLITAADDAKSLAIADHIAYTMTCMSAGIGTNNNIRSIGDTVRNGMILHQGRHLPL